MEATRPLFWNVDGKSIMYVLTFLTLCIFTLGMRKKILIWTQGKPGTNQNARAADLENLFSYLTLHNKRVFKSSFRRRIHLLVFYGFFVLLIGTVIVGLQYDFNLRLFYGPFYLILSFCLDLFGLAALAGVLMSGYKRYISKKESLSSSPDKVITLSLMFIILFSGFILEGLRIYATNDIWAAWSPVGLLFAAPFRFLGLSLNSARSAHAVFWYVHMVLALGFIAYIPYSNLLHMFASPLNLLLSCSPANTPIVPTPKGDQKVLRLGDLTRQQLIELDACVSCLRCEKHCPANESGSPLSPQELVQTLKQHANRQFSWWGKRTNAFDSRVLGPVISEETIYSCTMCGRCHERCPVQIGHVNIMLAMRRGMLDQDYPEPVKAVLGKIRHTGNPLGLDSGHRNHWTELAVPLMAEKQQSEVLYWVGCYGAFDSRQQQVARSMFRIFAQAGIDYAILGQEEKCCGDPARILGDERMFRHLAAENVQVLNKYKFKTIVTHCPHCFHTLKNLYPEFGRHYQVLHHSEFILQLIEAGKIRPEGKANVKVTFHDSCYLGRYNSIYDAQRQVLSSIPGLELVEMNQNRSKSLCCGAGGGRIFLADQQNLEISRLRIREAAETDSAILASACPLCLSNLTAGIQSLGSELINLDIAEIIHDLI